MKKHTPGPGLKVLSKEQWYGGGYCGICGHRGESLIPTMVRWWDPDDGWKTGVLCMYCGEEASEQAPNPRDYAFSSQAAGAERIDLLVEMGDLDSAHTATLDEFAQPGGGQQ